MLTWTPEFWISRYHLQKSLSSNSFTYERQDGYLTKFWDQLLNPASLAFISRNLSLFSPFSSFFTYDRQNDLAKRCATFKVILKNLFVQIWKWPLMFWTSNYHLQKSKYFCYFSFFLRLWKTSWLSYGMYFSYS